MKTSVVSLTFFFITLLSNTASAQQEPGRKRTVYMGLGSHRAFYSNSDIHLRGSGDNNFDFRLYDVKAKDDGGLKFNAPSAVQYSYVVGIVWNKSGWGVEFNFDHLKYFVQAGQSVRIEGKINERLVSGDTVLNKPFFHLEHSDGANYAMLNLIKWIPLTKPNQRHGLQLLLKGGAGVVVPKTNSTIMGKHYDEKYALSGYVTGAEAGMRYYFMKHLFTTLSFKGAYANYNNFRIMDGKGSQQWLSGQVNVLVGAQVSL